MRSKRRVMGLVFVLVAALSVRSVGHETWLAPAAFRTKSGVEMRLDLSSGMAYPALESAIDPKRVAKAAFRLGGKVVALPEGSAAPHSLALRATFPSDGLATVWVELAPKALELTDELVEEYFVDIAATAEVRAAWAKQRGKTTWRESYVKHAKSFVTVGEAAADDSWAEPIGAALELVPGSDPRSWRVGQPLHVTLRWNGKPCPRQPVGLVIEGATEPKFVTTDDDGGARFDPKRAGQALLYTTLLRPAADGVAWQSDFATLTFAIEAAAKTGG
ncbi:MAG: DUF4198 domain-containing protein [Planctomycetes bacterium]|nr:DUF4198 domain-containing protein [Planctomycetota bacterium]